MEILAPAGNAECGYAAIHAGADAVYLGANAFSARANADNFDEQALSEFIKKAHLFGVKVYVAMNTLVKEEELSAFLEQLRTLWNVGADAVILQDILLGKYIHKIYPFIPLHLSTQAGVCTENGARFAKDCGFSRVILARETPFSEIEKITKIIETECFVQGALCTAFSGQCYFSAFVGGNSGNRGRCKQPCRKKYAIDREKNGEYCYALSLSDLSVGEKISQYEKIGVSSLKIEGRMRRAEYVSAATTYYRSLLDKEMETKTNRALSDLKRTYNRGNYTYGLAFGQDNRFLSKRVQGHLGEKIGVVKVINGKYFVETTRLSKIGDAFKILRKGVEVGGAFFSHADRKGLYLRTNARLKNGDDVFITTDIEVNERLLQKRKTIPVCLSLSFFAGEKAVAQCGDITFLSDDILQSATSSPLTKEEIENCFLKTDGFPLDVSFSCIDTDGKVFMPKSRLNAFRRAFFERLCFPRGREREEEHKPLERKREGLFGINQKRAAILQSFNGNEPIDIAILKPNDYTKELSTGFLQGKFEKYIYYPAFLTSEEEKYIANIVKKYSLDGVYAENYSGIAFVQKENCKLFAATGFNLTNSVSVEELLRFSRVSYYALSKEISMQEAERLSGEKAFILSCGDIKLMDLCYCPFEKTCNECDKREGYILTDENGRNFPLRRYVSPDTSCRFEIYNCARLCSQKSKKAGELFDLSQSGNREILSCEREEDRKKILRDVTSGRTKNSVL